MQRITFHLGADNTTGAIDRERVVQVVGTHWQGATILWGTGIWEGQSEETAMIVIYAEVGRQSVETFAELLRVEFDQEEVYTLVEDL